MKLDPKWTGKSRVSMIIAAILVAISWTGAVIYAQTTVPTIHRTVATYQRNSQTDPQSSTVLTSSGSIAGINF